MGEAVGRVAKTEGLARLFERLVANPIASALGIMLLPVRIILGGIRQMREILGLLIFLGVGVLIAAAAVWYVTTVVQWWKASRGPPSLGSVTVLGLAEPQAKALSAALPSMVLSELRRLGEQTNQAKRQLQDLEKTQTRQAFPQDPRFEPVPVPEILKIEVAIPQQVAGVDIGWLLTWLKDLLAPTNVIDLTASYEAEGKKAALFGHAKGRLGYAFYVNVETGSPGEMAQAAAAAIIQQEQRHGEIGVQPLPPSAYSPVVDALSAYATYEKVVRSYTGQSNAPDFTSQYRSQLEPLAVIAEKYTQWGELQWIAAEIALRAGDRTKALAFTQNEQRLTPLDDPRYPRLAARLERLNERTAAAAASPKQREEAQAKAGERLEEQLVSSLTASIGLPAQRPAHQTVSIAFVGEPWPQALRTVQNKILRKAGQANEFLNDYTTGLLQTTRIIAPDATYTFAGVDGPRGAIATSELLTALDALAESQPDVLIFTYGPADPATLLALRTLARDIVVVLAAGNSGGLSTYAELDEVAAVVSGVHNDGSLAEFSDRSSHSVSAPAIDIPIVSPITGVTAKRNGSSYSAALVAGAAALLKASHPKATPPQIVNALRDSAKQPNRLIDVSAALKRLDERPNTQATIK